MLVTIRLQGSSATAPKPAFIESLHAAALVAMRRGRGGRPSSMLSGPEQQHQLPASNFDGLHTAIIAAPPEVLIPTPYVPTAAHSRNEQGAVRSLLAHGLNGRSLHGRRGHAKRRFHQLYTQLRLE
jgi:hypothetical protein